MMKITIDILVLPSPLSPEKMNHIHIPTYVHNYTVVKDTKCMYSKYICNYIDEHTYICINA